MSCKTSDNSVLSLCSHKRQLTHKSKKDNPINTSPERKPGAPPIFTPSPDTSLLSSGGGL